MTYRSVKKNKISKYAYLGVFSLFIFLIVSFWGGVRTVLAPVSIFVVDRFALSNMYIVSVIRNADATYVSKSAILDENAILKKKVESLENELADTRFMLSEREGQIANGASQTKVVISVYPLAKDITGVYGTIMLSKGFKSGLELGDVVYSSGDRAVCTITDIHPANALCTLFTASGIDTDAVVGSTTVSIKGDGNSQFVAYIPKTLQVETGSFVFLRSNPEYSLGVIRTIDKDPQSAFWKVYIEGNYVSSNAGTLYVAK